MVAFSFAGFGAGFWVFSALSRDPAHVARHVIVMLTLLVLRVTGFLQVAR